MEPKEIRDSLKDLIVEAKPLYPKLADKLENLQRWIRKKKDGQLRNKKYVISVLYQLIKDVKFFFFEKLIIVKIQSTLFTVLCILLLINAINLMDGVNGLLISHFIFWFILLIFKINIFFILILFFLTILLFMNLYNKLFLGNLGSGIIGTFLSIYVLKNQNNEDLLNVEKIFLLFIIPGLDMLRVFSERICNKKNPFIGDQNHLHHLLLKKYSKYKLLFVYCLISFLPIILTYSMKPEKLFYIITISTFAYVFFIIYLKKN
jgi:UDP-GlcNAc:undecaprenyl-phosphate GlcNAc-1-phosphate transferase